MDEFGIIETIFRPLAAKGAPAFNLENDTAVYTPPKGHDLVLTKDAMIEGVHYPGNLKPEDIAKRLLRANLSDLAAAGAKPVGYLLGIMAGATMDAAWLKGFAKGLREDQEKFGISLFGGDTTSGSKTTCLSLTALGIVPTGKALTRKGAKPGDLLCVSGSIGDAGLGLQSLQDKIPANPYLEARFKTPDPRVALGRSLIGVAGAAIDISDGLLADITHLLVSSGVAAEVYLYEIPLSREALEVVGKPQDRILELLAGGDDYELAFTVPKAHRMALGKISRTLDLPISVIGEIKAGKGLTLFDKNNKKVAVKNTGYRHFK